MSVQTEITRLSNAKSAIKTAIGNKGVTVPSTTKLDGMATLIGQIPTGTDTSDATAAAGDILSGKTAYVNGSKVTGNIATKTASNLSASGKTVTVPAGYYASQATKDVATGSATAPASISGSSATVSTGTNTLTLSKTVSVTPNVSAGYVSSGTAGNSSVSLTAAVTTKAAATITPGTTNQTIAAGTYLTGAQTIAGDADLVAGNIKKDVTIFGVTGTLAGGGDAWAAISVTYPAGSVCTATNGTTTLTAADTSGQVVFGIPEPSSTPETWTVSCTNGTDSDSTTVDIEEYGQSEYVTLRYTFVYGVSWDGTSATSWTRTDKAANFPDPVPYVSGASSYGSPFDNLYPWKDMTIVNDSAAGKMVKIPKFWYKLTQNGAGMSIQISNTAKSGYSVCPACMDRGDGKGERDYILVGRYHCANSTYKSSSNTYAQISKSRPDFRTSIQNLGVNIYMMDLATRFTIILLYLVEYANWNAQSTLGFGCGNNSRSYMGYTDNMPYHTGTNQYSKTTQASGVQYRNIEGLWDEVRDWIDGCYYSSNGLMVIVNPLQFSDSQNGISVGTTSNGYPKAFTCKEIANTFPLFIPTTSGGTSSTYSCDQFNFTSSNPCICVGGDYRPYENYGLFYVGCYGVTASNGYTGSRLMKLP